MRKIIRLSLDGLFCQARIAPGGLKNRITVYDSRLHNFKHSLRFAQRHTAHGRIGSKFFIRVVCCAIECKTNVLPAFLAIWQNIRPKNMRRAIKPYLSKRKSIALPVVGLDNRREVLRLYEKRLFFSSS